MDPEGPYVFRSLRADISNLRFCSQSLQTHRDLLAKISPTLFGFDLEVSLVVGMPSALQVSDPSTSSSSTLEEMSSRPIDEDLVTLYAEQGWEYVSLSSSVEPEDLNFMGDSIEGDEEIQISKDAKELGIDRDILQFARRPSLNQVKAGAREESGLSRIREALETCLWPNLERKDDRVGREARIEHLENGGVGIDQAREPVRPSNFSDWRPTAEDENQSSSMAGQNLSSPLQNTSSEMQNSDLDSYTSNDEALARAFLAKLGMGQDLTFSQLPEVNSSLGFGSQDEEEALRSGALRGPASDSKIWKDLEDFLKNEDPEWPIESGSSSRASGKQRHMEEPGISQLDREIFEELANEAREREKKVKIEDDRDAWSVRSSQAEDRVRHDLASDDTTRLISNADNGTSSSTTFDDDFSEFVSASEPTSSTAPSAAKQILDDRLFADEFPTPSEILAARTSIFGNHPTSSTRLKSNRASTSQELQAEEGFEFGQAVSAIQAHAERVRSIPDPEKRKREAARIALAFGMGLDGDEDELREGSTMYSDH